MAQPPQSRPEGAPDLKAKEVQDHHDVLSLAQHGDTRLAYEVYRDAYHDLAKKSPAEAAQYVRDMSTRFKQDGISEALAAQWGLELEQGKSSDSRLTSAQLGQMAANGRNPLAKSLAGELQKDIAHINPDKEGTILGFGGHDARSLSKHDLETYTDNKDLAVRAVEMGNSLLFGGKNCIFDQIARAAHKNPDDPNQPLTLDDFQQFAGAKGLNPQIKEQVQHCIDRWDQASLNSLATYFDGATLLTKRSIEAGLKTMREQTQER